MEVLSPDFDSPPVIVIGMHRSGTTLLSHLLRTMGVHMGADTTTRTDESVFFRNLNDGLLDHASARWHRPSPMWETLSNQSCVRRLAEQLESTWNSAASLEFRRCDLPAATRWGWKDPRTTITLPIWLQLFRNAQVIHIVRYGVDVSDSLVRRSRIRKRLTWAGRGRAVIRFMTAWQQSQIGPRPIAKHRFRSLDEAFELWNCYLLFAEYGMQGVSSDRIHRLRFEDLTEQPKRELEQLACFVGCRQTPSEIEKMAELVNGKRAWAFTDSADLIGFADRHHQLPVMKRYGYGSEAQQRLSDRQSFRKAG